MNINIFVVISVLTIAPSIYASDPQGENPHQESSLGSMFSVNQIGEQKFSFGYDLDSQTDLKMKYLGTKYQDSKATSKSLNISYSNGVSERLTLAAGISYQSENLSNYSYGPASTSNGQSYSEKSVGLSDPSFAAMYRLKQNQQDNVNVNLDFGITMTPKTSNKKGATKTEDGNNLQGG